VNPAPPETTGEKQSTRFQKGASGNPAGRPKGSRHRYLMAAEMLLDGEAEKLTRKAIELALDGDMTALRLCMERIVPARRDRPILVDLPIIESVRDASKAAAVLVAAVAAGELTPTEAADVSKLLDNYTRILEAQDFEERLQILEGKTGA
jgi:hypothetical protein